MVCSKGAAEQGARVWDHLGGWSLKNAPVSLWFFWTIVQENLRPSSEKMPMKCFG